MKWLFFLALFFSPLIFADCIAIRAPLYFDGEQFHFNNKEFIVIEDNLITKITVTPPTECIHKEYKNATIVPGLIDLHSLIFATDETFSTDYAKGVLLNSKMSRKDRISMAKYKLKSYLAAGFTTIRDLGNSGQYLDVLLRNSLNKLTSPRLILSGPGISAIGGQFSKDVSFNTVGREYDQLKSIGQITSLLATRKKKSVDVVKLYADNDPNPNSLTEQELVELTRKASTLGFMTAIHATNVGSIQRAINASPTTIEHGFNATMSQLIQMKQKNIFLIPTDPGTYLYNILKELLPVGIRKRFKSDYLNEVQRSKQRLQLARKAGTQIGFGSDFYLPIEKLGLPFIDGVYSSLFALKDAGYSNGEVLKFATSNAAKAIKISNIGHIKVQFIADILIVRGNLYDNLQNLKNVITVIKNGKATLTN